MQAKTAIAGGAVPWGPYGSRLLGVVRSLAATGALVIFATAVATTIADLRAIRESGPGGTAIGAWKAVAAMADARVGAGALLLPDGQVLVVGGSGFQRRPGGGTVVGGRENLRSAELYDIQRNRWVDAGEMAARRIGQYPVILMSDGRVLVAGGTSSDRDRYAEFLDPSTGAWVKTRPMLRHRMASGAALLKDGRVIVAGGGGIDGALASVEFYDSRTNVWSVGPAMSTARIDPLTAVLTDGRLLVVGGYIVGGNSEVPVMGVELYDPVRNSWSSAGPVRNPQLYAIITQLPDGRVILAGGYRPESGPSLVPVPSVEIFDPRTDSWSTAAQMTTPRGGATATLLNNGKVLVVGGYTSPNTRSPVSSAEVYDPETDRWSPVASMTTPRSGHTATLLTDGRVLVAGGAHSSGAIASAEIFDLTAVGSSQGAESTPGGPPRSTLVLAALACLLALVALAAQAWRRVRSS